MFLSHGPSQGRMEGAVQLLLPRLRGCTMPLSAGTWGSCGSQLLEVARRCLSRDSLQNLKVAINWWGPGCLARAHLPQGIPTYLVRVWEALWALQLNGPKATEWSRKPTCPALSYLVDDTILHSGVRARHTLSVPFSQPFTS